MANTQVQETLSEAKRPLHLPRETWRERLTASPWTDVVRRLARNKLALVGLAIIGVVMVVALFAPVLAQQDPDQNGVFKAYPRQSK